MESIVSNGVEKSSEVTAITTDEDTEINSAELDQPPLGLSLSTSTIDTAAASPPLASLTRRKAKKPLVNRLQKAAGKMFSYVRPPKHNGSVSSSSQSYCSENESPSSKVSLSLSDV
jgi:hypothetical protein